jgi:hypothetical protein
MESWQHLLVRVVPGGPGTTFELTPRLPGLRDDQWRTDREGTLALLNQLGDDRWQLVSADFDAGEFWMKRVTDPDAPALH